MSTEVPRWLELQAEIDFNIWQLTNLRDAVAARTALDCAIDKATGHEDQLAATAQELIDTIRSLRSEFDALGGVTG